MTLTQLINAIGDDNVRLQFIKECLISAKDKKRTADTELTIATNQINSNDIMRNTGPIGIVLWINQDAYNKAVEDLSKEAAK